MIVDSQVDLDGVSTRLAMRIGYKAPILNSMPAVFDTAAPGGGAPAT